MPTKHGLFMAHCFKSLVDGIEHIALVKAPNPNPNPNPNPKPNPNPDHVMPNPNLA